MCCYVSVFRPNLKRDIVDVRLQALDKQNRKVTCWISGGTPCVFQFRKVQFGDVVSNLCQHISNYIKLI